MDYSAMWSVVDAHRRCADELEQTLRELTGDLPAPDPDKIDTYNRVLSVLRDAQDELHRIADREHQSVRRLDSARCRVYAARCEHLIAILQKQGEL